MLRDPIAQVVSHYRHIKRDTNHFLYERFRDKTLHEFLHDPDYERIVCNFQTLNLAVDADPRVFAKSLTAEQMESPGIGRLMLYMYDHVDGQELLERVKARLQEFAFVGILERFSESLELLTYTFHWKPLKEIHLNSDPKPQYEISPEDREWLMERNQLDLQLHEFALQLVETRLREMNADLLQTNMSLVCQIRRITLLNGAICRVRRRVFPG